ncbi:hypothetical protein EVA_11166 [gut metagenome]|uniref:Anti-sigma factor n=1 Tax=gut metagenome TaxID=749906 RepID=J9GG10_9ZZZZ
MGSDDIEQLLERYWAGNTSVEEEKRLQAWFAKGDVPDHLRCYQPWFDYVKEEQAEHLDDDFDVRMLAMIEKPVVKACRMSLITRFMPLFKAAAVVALLVGLGNMMQHPLWSDSEEITAVDTIGNQIKAPSVALSVDVTKKDAQLLDSLQHVMQQERKNE